MRGLALTALVSVISVSSIFAHPCDSEHGQVCPEASGLELGECLTSLSAVSPECQKWLDFHTACSSELSLECGKRCEGFPCAFTEDAIPCIAFWTHDDNRALYSSSCKAVLPAPKKRAEQSEERKRRNEERKRRRKEKVEAIPDTPLNLPDPTEL